MLVTNETSKNKTKKKKGILVVKDARFKACLMEKGYTQKKGVNFNEVFYLGLKHSSIIVLLAMVALFDLELKQCDVNAAFLHGELE